MIELADNSFNVYFSFIFFLVLFIPDEKVLLVSNIKSGNFHEIVAFRSTKFRSFSRFIDAYFDYNINFFLLFRELFLRHLSSAKGVDIF